MILVTGGTGMVGGDVVRLLSRQGVAARALVRNPQKAPDLPGITWVTGGSPRSRRRCAPRSQARTRCFSFRASARTPWRCSTTPSWRHETPASGIS